MESQMNIPSFVIYGSIVLLLIATIVIIYLVIRLTKSERGNKVIEEKYQEMIGRYNKMQLENIESRLNPHLFKNILNSVQSHAYQTYFALNKLANVLDYMLYDSRKPFVTPKQEVEFALNLIEINKIKLSPLFDLKVKLKINENEPLYHQKVMAPFIFTDLIENAFKHADLQSSGAFISIIFEFSDNTFNLTVANKISAKAPIEKEYSGFGSKALEDRLKIVYENHYKLDRFTEENVYIAHLKINLLEFKAKMLVTGR